MYWTHPGHGSLDARLLMDGSCSNCMLGDEPCRCGNALACSILLNAVLVLGAGVFFWSLSRLRVAWGWDHRPTAKLHIATHQPAILFIPEESDSRDAEVVYKRFIKTQLTLMVSRPVINAALQLPGISQLRCGQGPG